jgi:hemerythrin
MLADDFTQIFRAEHRQVRDALIDLIDAFQRRERQRISELLDRIATLTGPHFRYEEEALYPSLTEIFGEEYIEKLLSDHDRAIATARGLVALAAKDELTDADITDAAKMVRSILPHVSDCDGLSIMVERLAEAKVRGIFDARERSLNAGLNLLQWADAVRGRPIAVS